MAKSVLKLNFLRLFGGKAVTIAKGPTEAKRGGSIYMSGLKALFQAHTVLFDGCGAAGGLCAWLGGTLALHAGSIANIIDSTFQSSRAGSFGGAITIEGENTTLTLTNTAFVGNSASKGAGVYAQETGKIRLVGGDNVFRGNKAQTIGSGHSIFLKQNAPADALWFDICRSGSFQDDGTRRSQLSGAAYFIDTDFDGCEFECTFPETTIGYGPHSGADACSVPCTAGMFYDTTPSNTSLWACRHMTTPACPSGYGFSSASARVGLFGSDQDDGTCTPCDIGKHKASGLATVCDVCGPGKFANTTGASACHSCTLGKYLAADHTSAASLHDAEADCDLCEKGRFNAQPGSGSCYPCEFAFKRGEISCEGCDPGKYFNRTTGCQNCVPGTFTDAKNQLSCTKCASGTFAAETAAAFCTKCSRGKYGQSGPGATSEGDACADCPRGSYMEKGGQVGLEACKLCPKGKWSDQIGLPEASLCVGCGTGRYSNMDGAVAMSACDGCKEGKFSESIGAGSANTCLGCPEGFSQKDIASAYCLPCLPGRFGNVVNQSRCVKCPTGFASEYAESKTCQECAEGRFALDEGSASCSSCSTGMHEYTYTQVIVLPGGGAGGRRQLAARSNTRDGCRTCPGGWVQPGRKQTACLQCGVHRDALEGSTKCLDCEPGRHTMNESNSTSGCRSCPAGWYQKLKGATECVALLSALPFLLSSLPVLSIFRRAR